MSVNLVSHTLFSVLPRYELLVSQDNYNSSSGFHSVMTLSSLNTNAEE